MTELADPTEGTATDVDDTFDEEDYANYERGVGAIIKKIWITLQVIIMTQFMIRGLIYYCRSLKKFSKVHCLLIFQGAQFLYLLINEYTTHNMLGIYLNLLFCSYGHFLTFCIVMDWCLSEEDD